jgi:hypothetical protein
LERTIRLYIYNYNISLILSTVKGSTSMNIAGGYIGKGLTVSGVMDILHIPKPTFYRNQKEDLGLPMRKGRHRSMLTMRKISNETV